MPTYKQGDNLPEIVVKIDRDATDYIPNVRATAGFNGNVVSGVDDLATEIKLDEITASRLKRGGLGTGIRAFLSDTNEWILITAINGITATVTRAENDPGGNPTVAAAIKTYANISIIPLDNVPILATLDASDTSNQTVSLRLDPADTNILPGEYELDILFQDDPANPSGRFTYESPEPLVIKKDINKFGF